MIIVLFVSSFNLNHSAVPRVNLELSNNVKSSGHKYTYEMSGTISLKSYNGQGYKQ